MPSRRKGLSSTTVPSRLLACGYCGVTFQGAPARVDAAMVLHKKVTHQGNDSGIPTNQLMAKVSVCIPTPRPEKATTMKSSSRDASGITRQVDFNAYALQ